MANSIFWSLISFYLYIISGFIIVKIIKDRAPKADKIVTMILMDILMPIQVFLSLTLTTFGTDAVFLFQILGLGLLSIIVLMGTSYLSLRKRVKNQKMLGSYLLLNSLPNSILYVIPIVIAIFNEELTIIPVLFAIMAHFLRGTFITYVCQKLGTNKSMNFKESLFKLITFPPFIGLLLGLIFRSFQIPISNIPSIKEIKSINDQISSAVAGILIGLILGKLKFPEISIYKKDLGIVALWRFGFSCLFYLCFVFFLHFPIYEHEIRIILFLIFLGPPAVFNVAFAIYFSLEEKFAAVTVATLTLVAILLMPLFLLIGFTFF